MTYNPDTNIITSNMSKIKKSEKYKVIIKIKDSRGAESDLNIEITVIKYVNFIKPEVIEEKKIIEKVEVNMNKNISADIKSIGPMGELLLTFNETMQTNISQEYYNTSMVLWVEPANDR